MAYSDTDSQMTAEKIIKGWNACEADDANWRNFWQAVADYFDINRASFVTKRTPGERRTKNLFDSTGLKASAELAAIIHSIVTNPASQWFGLMFGTSDFEADEQAKTWLADCSRRMFDALNASNFNVAVTTSYRDYGNFGSMVNEMQPQQLDSDGRFTGVRFRSVFMAEISPILDSTNRLIGYYKLHRFTYDQAKGEWPEAEFPEEMARKAETPEGKKKEYEFVEHVYRRDDIEYEPGTVATPDERPFKKTIVCKDQKCVIMETGVYRIPFYLTTWNRAPGERWGRGPGFEALPDMRSLNEVVRMDLEATAMAIRPPMKTRYNNIVGDMRLVPGGLTITRDPAGLMPFDTGSRIQESKIRIDDLRRSVRSIFLLDKLALPPRDEVGEMTAYEIQRRVQEMNQILGPILARLNEEFLDPMITDLFYIMLRDGGFEEPPESVLSADVPIKIQFVNPLARAQKAEEMAAVQRWMGDLMALANAGKVDALDLIATDEVGTGSAENYGVPQNYITPKAEREKVRKQRAEQQQQAFEMEQAVKQADAMNKSQQGADRGGRPEGS